MEKTRNQALRERAIIPGIDSRPNRTGSVDEYVFDTRDHSVANGLE
jgi:hypothetical protein